MIRDINFADFSPTLRRETKLRDWPRFREHRQLRVAGMRAC
ncbi:MAG: hypothetical protein ABW023_01840 [Sphingomonas sp.]